MSQKDMVFHVGVDMSADIADVESKFSKLKTTITNMKMPTSSAKELNEVFERAAQGLEEFTTLQKKSGHTEADVKKIQQAYRSVTDALDVMSRKVAGIEAINPERLLPKGLRTQVSELTNELQRLASIQGGTKSTAYKALSVDIKKQKAELDGLSGKVDQLKNSNTVLEQKQRDLTSEAQRLNTEYEVIKESANNMATALANARSKSNEFGLEKSSVYAEQVTKLTEERKKKTLEISKLEEKIKNNQLVASTASPQEKQRKETRIQIDTSALAKQKKEAQDLDAAIEMAMTLESQAGEQEAEISRLEQDYLELARAIQEYEAELRQNKQETESTVRAIEKNAAAMEKQEKAQEQARAALKLLKDEQKQIKSESKNFEQSLQKVRDAILQISPGADVAGKDLVELETILRNLASNEINKIEAEMDELRSDMDGAAQSADKLGTNLQENFMSSAQSMMTMRNQLDQLSSNMLYFFSLTNGWQLLRQAIQKAIDVVKELDAAMTEIAVVSDYTVDEIWSMRSEYSRQATIMGAKTIDLVNATKLYVQQGLTLNEALEVGIETTKMARIANLDGAEATNLMTAALRGFNMEMNEANRVNDTYSQLAAKSAADTQEIATAMSKTASIAANAGSSFENMSAFLTQIIETTREAAETAGTAMKTIIARFQELKKPMSEIGEVDGEIVDANGIEAALREANIALRDHKGEFRDFDEVILELAQKWDDLDVMTQRYIATMAAGSRQQSRFIALMSDSERLMELVGYANNAAGASNQQYEKTLESLEAKLNKLSNAMDIFWTNLANNKIIKSGIDLITNVIEQVNNLTATFTQSENSFMNFLGSLMQLGLAVGAFFAQQKLITNFFVWIGAQALRGGAEAGEKTRVGFMQGMQSHGGLLGMLQHWKKQMTAAFADMKVKAVKFGADLRMSMNGYGPVTQALETIRHETALYNQTLRDQAGNEKLVAQATTSYNASLTQQMQLMGMNTSQMQMANTLRGYGVAADTAALASLNGLNNEKLQEILNDQSLVGASQAVINSRVQEIAAQEAQNQSLNKLNASQMGAGAKIGGTIKGLFGFSSASRAAGAEVAGLSTKTSLLGAAMKALPLGWIIVGVVALVAAFKMWDNYVVTTEEELENLSKSIEENNNLLAESKQKLNDLTNERNELTQMTAEFEDLTKGTEEWKEKLVEINSQVLDLINKYPKLAQYLGRGSNGELTISEVGWDILIQEQRAATSYQQTSAAQMQLRQEELQSQLNAQQARMADRDKYQVQTGMVQGSLETMQLVQGLANPWFAAAGLIALLGDVAVKIFTGRGITERIGDAITEAQSGASEKEWQKILSIAGENGLQSWNETELREIFIDVTGSSKGFDNFYDNVQQLGEDFDDLQSATYSNTLQQEAQRDVIIANVTAANEKIDDSDYAKQATTMADYMFDNIGNYSLDELESKLGSIYDQNDGEIKQGLKNEYAKVQGLTIDEINAKLEEKSLSEDTMAYAVQAARDQEMMSEAMERTVEELESLELILGKDNKLFKALKNLMTEEGLGATETQTEVITSQLGINNIEDIENLTQESINTFLKQGLNTSLDALGIDVSTFKTLLTNSMQSIAEAYDEAQSISPAMKSKVQGAVQQLQAVFADELSIGATKSYADILVDIEKRGGDVDQFTALIKAMADTVNTEDQQSFISNLTAIDWSSENSIDSFVTMMANLGYTFGTLADDAKIAANAIADVDFSKISDDLLNTKTGVDQFANTISYAFEETQMNLLIEKGFQTKEDFIKISEGENDGKWNYTGESTAYELRQGLNSIAPDITVDFETFEKYKKVYKNAQQKYTDKDQDYHNSLIETIDSVNTQTTNLIDKLNTRKSLYDSYVTSGLYAQDFGTAKAQNEGMASNAEEFSELIAEGFVFTDPTTGQKTTINWDDPKALFLNYEEYLRNTTSAALQSTNAQQTDLKTRETALSEAKNNYSDSVNSIKTNLQKIPDIIKTQDLAASYKLIDSLTKVLSQDEFANERTNAVDALYSAVISRGGAYGLGQDTLQALKKEKETASLTSFAISELLIDAIEEIDYREMTVVLSKKFSDAFEKVELYSKLSTSGAKEKVVQQMLEAIVPSELIDDVKNTFKTQTNTTAWEELYDWILLVISGNYEAYGSMFSKNNFDTSESIIKSQSNDVEDLYNLRAMGYVVTNLMEVNQGNYQDLIGSYIQTATDDFQYIADEAQAAALIGGTHAVASMMSETDYAVFYDELNTEVWENSYDWLYNLTARLNKVLRERNKLEEEENRILESRALTTDALLENLGKQYTTNLMTLAAYQKLQEQRVSQNPNDDIISEIEKFQSELKDLNLTEYMWFENGTFQIDWNKIDQITDTAEGETISQYISEGEFLQGELEDIEDGITETNDKLQELRNKYISNASKLESSLIDAIVTLREREIEQLEEVNSSISNANSKLLEEIQEGIEDIRNAREDDKSLQNIQEMEQRLALMRTDTSGTNALDILSLEKELEEARQEYQDTQIDRAIDEMTKQNEYAAEQRQLQIDLMKEQLEADKKYGEIARQVNELLSGELDATKEGTIKGILSKVGDQDGLARFGKEEYMNGLQDSVSTGIAGIVYGSAASQGTKITFTDKNGKLVTGTADANGMIVDDKKNVYSAVYQNGAGEWLQHSSGTKYTETEWQKQVNAAVNGLSLGNTDLVEVNDATTVAITAKSVQLNVAAPFSSNSTNWDELKTSGVNYLKNLGEEQKAQDLQSSFGKFSQSHIQLAYGMNYADIINGIAKGTTEVKDSSDIQTATINELIRNFPTLTAFSVDSRYKNVLAQDLASKFNLLTEKDLGQYLPSLKHYERYYHLNNIYLKTPDGGTIDSVQMAASQRKYDTDKLTEWFNNYKHLQYKTGGLADFTGPAWLDGTKARPEYVLNAAQTQGFLTLVDVLDNYNDKKSDKGSGDTYYDVHIEVDEISSDYDVEEMMDKMKRIIADDAMYRNVNAVDLGRR